MRFPRRSGVLLHLTSLPGPGEVGRLGDEAYRFVDFLEEAGQKLWQVLPLNPLGYGSSPYASTSAFAGNALLISPEKLVEDGLLSPGDVPKAGSADPNRADFIEAEALQEKVLEKVRAAFNSDRSWREDRGFREFLRRESFWLDNYALYVSLKRNFRGAPWYKWPKGPAFRKPGEIEKCREELASSIEEVKFIQYLFFRQWEELRRYANGKGIEIVGDIPIFVNHDSADVWEHRELFYLDEKGKRTILAGVPPVGNFNVSQIWGNPLYRWDRMADNNYRWWTERFATALRLVDIVRVDHFTGFCKTWHVPLGAKTSAEGEWVKGPGAALFEIVRKTLGDVPIIAEDLGPIQLEVDVLLEETGFPGIRVIQFASEENPDDMHLPRNYPDHCAAYSGTHDTDTIVGWFESLNPAQRKWLLVTLETDSPEEINWKVIRTILSTKADTAIIPLQDILGLGSGARMNNPGAKKGQWEWRFREEMLEKKMIERLARLTAETGR